MVRPCPSLPTLTAPPDGPLEAQVEAWRVWSLLVVRRYTECARKQDLWRAWAER